jgi:hypothetical protein
MSRDSSITCNVVDSMTKKELCKMCKIYVCSVPNQGHVLEIDDHHKDDLLKSYGTNLFVVDQVIHRVGVDDRGDGFQFVTLRVSPSIR